MGPQFGYTVRVGAGAGAYRLLKHGPVVRLPQPAIGALVVVGTLARGATRYRSGPIYKRVRVGQGYG